jgi:hypothetical protein
VALAVDQADMVLVLVALVVVPLHIGHQGAAGLQRDECDQLQSAYCSATLHSFPLSR